MNDHIAKPINIGEMFKTMAKWITPSAPAAARNTQQKEDVIIPLLEGIDTADGLARTQGNGALYLKLLQKVASSQKDFIDQITEARDTNDWQLAERLAHTLKGIAGNIGAAQLRDCCAVLEEQAKRKCLQQENIEIASTVLTTVLTSLASLPLPAASSSHQPVNSGDLQPIVKRLIQQLEDFDTAAQETFMTNRDLFFTTPIAKLGKDLEKSLSRYDFGQALQIAQRIQQASTTNDDTPASFAEEAFEKILKEGLDLLKEYNTEATAFFETHRSYFVQMQLLPDFLKIQQALEKYDFTEASSVVEKIALKFDFAL
jgi:HPt (histidine-containing phosphotransfer) domain-containing protein